MWLQRRRSCGVDLKPKQNMWEEMALKLQRRNPRECWENSAGWPAVPAMLMDLCIIFSATRRLLEALAAFKKVIVLIAVPVLSNLLPRILPFPGSCVCPAAALLDPASSLGTKLGRAGPSSCAANQFLQCPGVQQGCGELNYESLFVDWLDLSWSRALLF